MQTQDLDLSVILAHEVKNPVALIKANIEYLELDNNVSIYQKNISVIKKELMKINNIISDFTHLFKSTETKNFKDVLLFDMVSDVIEEFKVSNKTNKFTFSLICEDEDVIIKTEYSKLSIVLFNIYKNALEAMRNKTHGNIETKIYTLNDRVCIEIKDDGDGIDESIIEFIGKPFFTSKKEGSGLGVLICKNIISDLGGTFNILNDDYRGCKVILEF